VSRVAVKRGKPSALEVVVRTIHFEDWGQDFLEWDLNSEGVVIAVRPAQEWAWKGAKVFEPENLGPGHGVRFMRFDQEGSFVVKYHVEKVVTP
jgi:hypothetical protein